MKEYEGDGTCSMHGGEEICINLNKKSEGKK
jgi:hypothetical protein